MPELPETETIARDLHGAIAGAQVASVQLLRPNVLRGAAGSKLASMLTSRTVTRAWRRAKSVILSFDHDIHAVVTPRFTGALIIGALAEPDDYACVRLPLMDGRELRYTDVRRLGTFAVLTTGELDAWSGTLGPEPLDAEFTPERLSVCIRGSKRAVKAVLMDQKRLAGVGNIYANEALWRAGIKPSRRASSITRAQGALLHRALVDVLHASIAARGTSFRDYRDAFGQRGGFAALLQAYGRGGRPCARCGATLRETHAIEGRSTVWCAECQR